MFRVVTAYFIVRFYGSFCIEPVKFCGSKGGNVAILKQNLRDQVYKASNHMAKAADKIILTISSVYTHTYMYTILLYQLAENKTCP